MKMQVFKTNQNNGSTYWDIKLRAISSRSLTATEYFELSELLHNWIEEITKNNKDA